MVEQYLLHETQIDYSALLHGKTAFITSASQGIGKAIALLFAKHGATIALGGRNEKKTKRAIAEVKAFSENSEAFLFDLSNKEEIEEICDKILSDFGRIDLLVNTVGVNRTSSAHRVSDEDLDYMINTNYKSGLYCARKFIPGMIQRKSGNIINISSIHSLQTNGECAVYAGTKGAIDATTRAMAVDYAGYGIRVNAILPGLILSDFVMDRIRRQKEDEKAAYIEVLKNAQPLPPGQVQDIANAALFLASDMAAYITGQTLIVDGGAKAAIKW